MSDGEVDGLRRAIERISSKQDDQHRANQQRIQETDARYKAIEDKVDDMRSDVKETSLLLKLLIGSGQPGEGRVGALEQVVEELKKFRWQALAILALILLAAEHSNLLTGLVKH